ncbi:zinc finger protein BALDIBIS [Tanacetum coccineum]|uniref:Zinc finger protein BALDIBIS n=1 Tax=Tanacetum coccineum TaxID=301880 RepID=A0ABQ4ZXW3_9ASTR
MGVRRAVVSSQWCSNDSGGVKIKNHQGTSRILKQDAVDAEIVGIMANPKEVNPEAEVIAMSPKTLMATNRFVCQVCNKWFQRDQNLHLHRRGPNLPWKLKQRSKTEVVGKKAYVCPEPSCVHHEPARALGYLTGIKKNLSRKHGEKKWKCEKCSNDTRFNQIGKLILRFVALENIDAIVELFPKDEQAMRLELQVMPALELPEEGLLPKIWGGKVVVLVVLVVILEQLSGSERDDDLRFRNAQEPVTLDNKSKSYRNHNLMGKP